MNESRIHLLRSMLVAAALTIFSCDRVQAWDFVPTPEQWASWPGYCKAKYMITNVGSTGEYAGRVPAEIVEKWHQRLGDQAWTHIHHGCSGISRVMSATMMPPGEARKRLADTAYSDAHYTATRIGQKHFLWAKMEVVMALATDLAGDYDKSIGILQQALQIQPASADVYSAFGKLYFDHQKYEEARDILTTGDSKVGGRSAEIHYFLGLTLFELKSYDEAAVHARAAQRLGYPLPALIRKLRAAGHWSD